MEHVENPAVYGAAYVALVAIPRKGGLEHIFGYGLAKRKVIPVPVLRGYLVVRGIHAFHVLSLPEHIGAYLFGRLHVSAVLVIVGHAVVVVEVVGAVHPAFVKARVGRRPLFVTDNLVHHRCGLLGRGNRQAAAVDVGRFVTLAVHAAVVKVGVMHREVAVVGMVLHVLPGYVVVVAHYEQIVQCGIFGIRFLYLGLHSVAVPATFQYLVHAEAEQFFPLGEPVYRLCIFVYRDYEVIPRVVACCDTGCLDCHIACFGRSPVHGYVTQHVVGWQYYGLCRRCARHCPRPGLGNEAHFVRYLAVCPRLVRGRVILHGIHNDVAYLPPPVNGPTPRRYGNFAGIETALRGILAAFFYHTLCRSAFFRNTPRRSEAAIIVNERRIHGFHHRRAAFGHGECVDAERSGVTAGRVAQPEAFNPPHAAPVPGIAGRGPVAGECISHGNAVVRALHGTLRRVHAAAPGHFRPGIRASPCRHGKQGRRQLWNIIHLFHIAAILCYKVNDLYIRSALKAGFFS